MGAGMDKVLPGLYVGSIRDSKDKEQLTRNQITHILSIYEDPKDGGLEVKINPSSSSIVD
jgi:atypical dual specificity phosphatase